jgi:pimeloyl-ACP methyl ester carboxylesterase
MPQKQPIAHESQLTQIDLPVLVISCHDDPVHPFAYGQWYADRISGARFVEVPAKSVDAQGYHDQLNEAIYGWLDNLK